MRLLARVTGERSEAMYVWHRCWRVPVLCVCVYYCRTFYKAVRVGEEESGGHVL